MIKILIQSDVKERAVDIVQSAIASEIKRLEQGLHKTDRHIEQFEKKYNILSVVFLEKLFAEDLEGQDQEYIEWAGELKLREKILTDLNHLKGIEYVAQ